MDKILRRLPDSELEVMLALWRAEGEAPRAWLERELADFGWSPNTINTYLARLTAKGFVSCRREGKANFYLPNVKKEDYLSFESESVLGKLYGGSVASFVAALSGARGLEQRDMDELQKLLSELRGRESGG